MPRRPSQPDRAKRRPPARTAADSLPADRAALCEVRCVDDLTVQRARRVLPASAAIDLLAETFRALGDPTRLRIVAALAREELCVCDLATVVGASQSTVSHSLRALRQLRLVRYRKAGKVAYYALDDEHIAALLGEGLRHVEAPAAPRRATSRR